MTRKLLMTVAIMLSRSPPPSALVLPRPTALAEVLVVAVSTAAGLAATVSMAEVLTAAVLPGAIFSTGVFSAGMVAFIQATVDTGMPRTVTIRSTARPPATDRV
jgi:hypothetical protein